MKYNTNKTTKGNPPENLTSLEDINKGVLEEEISIDSFSVDFQGDTNTIMSRDSVNEDVEIEHNFDNNF